MTSEVRSVPWWENDAYRESLIIEQPSALLDFLVKWLQPEDLAAMMQVDITQVSDWLVNSEHLSHEHETRLRLVYRVVKTTFNYAGELDGLTLIDRPYMEFPPIRVMMAEMTDEREILDRVRQKLLRSWKNAPPKPPQEGE